MAGRRRFRSSASERACLQCQKRKTRCVSNAANATCSYCAKMSKACVFETPPTRTPLTRRNLDAAEARCKELELRLRELQSDTKTKSSTSNHNRNSAAGFPKEHLSSLSPHLANTVRKPVESPAELGFEWQEISSLGNSQSPLEEKKIQDGMVSLAASGYSGKIGLY